MSELGTTGKFLDPRGVDHPRHYNMHPSGVEVIEIKRYLISNIADAFKYVLRQGEKGDQRKDLEKALWYLRDQLAGGPRPPRTLYVLNAQEFMQRVILAETRLDMLAFLNGVDHYSKFGATQDLYNAVMAVESMLAQLDEPWGDRNGPGSGPPNSGAVLPE